MLNDVTMLFHCFVKEKRALKTIREFGDKQKRERMIINLLEYFNPQNDSSPRLADTIPERLRGNVCSVRSDLRGANLFRRDECGMLRVHWMSSGDAVREKGCPRGATLRIQEVAFVVQRYRSLKDSPKCC
uniref:Uncharacterized protein n=1 Tax=Steinernema glaseri TaxID=37863 RepID=A0A1I7YZ25_9BILA